MKTLYTIFILAFIVGNLYAQQPTEISAVNYRLVDFKNERWYAGRWEESDSIHFTYSGSKGGTEFTGTIEPDYDVKHSYAYPGGALTNSALSEKTFDANSRLTQSLFKIWNGAAWENYNRQTNTYNAQGQTNATREAWNGSAWIGTNRTSYNLDASGNILLRQYDQWSLTANRWEAYDRRSNTYNPSNKILTSLTEMYSGTAWVNFTRFTNTYDANGNILSKTNEVWNTGGSNWQFTNRTFYTHTAANLLQTEIYQLYSGGSWTDRDRTTYTYNWQAYLTEKLVERYSAGTWQNADKAVYTINSEGSITEILYSSWSAGIWRESSRARSTYDAAGNLLLTLYSEYVLGTWNDLSSTAYTYYSFNLKATSLSLANSVSPVNNDRKLYYYYETYDDGTNGISTIPTLTSTVLPNPFTINVAIQVNATTSGNHTFEVYNMAGQRVHTESRYFAPGQQTIVWEGQDVPKGVYFYKINSASGVASGKLVKQ